MLKQTRGMLLCRRYWEMIGISSMRGIRLERWLLMIDEAVYLMLRSLRIRGQYLTNSVTTILRILSTNTKTWSVTRTISDNLFIHYSLINNRKSREDMWRNVSAALSNKKWNTKTSNIYVHERAFTSSRPISIVLRECKPSGTR
jgi:hypothetical protein